MRHYLLIAIILFLQCYVISGCRRYDDDFEVEESGHKDLIALQEVLSQAVFDDITVNEFTVDAFEYTLSFSNGIRIKLKRNLLLMVYIGDNGNWFANGSDTGFNAFSTYPVTPTAEIVSGVLFINGENTRFTVTDTYVKYEDEALYVSYIIELSDYWLFGLSDESFVQIVKGPQLYSIENEIVNSFLKEVEYDITDYSYSKIHQYRVFSTYYPKDRPHSIIINWGNIDYDATHSKLQGKKLIVTDNIFYNTTTELSLDARNFSISNLTPNISYSIRVIDYFEDGTQNVILSKKVLPTGQLKMLAIDGKSVWNYRDLGGWKTIDGKTIKYDTLLRGGEVFRDDSFEIMISTYGIHQLLKDLGVDVELDFGDFSFYSPLVDYGVEFIHGPSYQIIAYENGIQDELGRQRYANCLKLIIKSTLDGNTVLFHCNAGADRTGTLAFLIEGLLGVSESDMAKDYELTSFSGYSERRRNSDEYKSFVSFIKQHYSGKTLNEKIENMALQPINDGGLGLLEEDLLSLRRSLLVN